MGGQANTYKSLTHNTFRIITLRKSFSLFAEKELICVTLIEEVSHKSFLMCPFHVQTWPQLHWLVMLVSVHTERSKNVSTGLKKWCIMILQRSFSSKKMTWRSERRRVGGGTWILTYVSLQHEHHSSACLEYMHRPLLKSMHWSHDETEVVTDPFSVLWFKKSQMKNAWMNSSQ